MENKIKMPGFIINSNDETLKSWFAKKNDSYSKTNQILPMRAPGSHPPVECPDICVSIKNTDGTVIEHACGCAIFSLIPFLFHPHPF